LRRAFFCRSILPWAVGAFAAGAAVLLLGTGLFSALISLAAVLLLGAAMSGYAVQRALFYTGKERRV